MSESVGKDLKAAVAARAGACCEYCWSQSRFSPDPFSIEHILPVSKGGSNELENLALACQGCNNRKYTHTEAIDPITGEMVSLYHPRQDPWSQHFKWSSNFSLIFGMSPTGRATVEKLKLNREGLVNLRRILNQVDEHPPEIP